MNPTVLRPSLLPSIPFARRMAGVGFALVLGCMIVGPVNAAPADAVWAWGNNQLGQTTVPVMAQSGVKAIAAGGYHTLALKTDGSVVAWGMVWDGHSFVPEVVPAGLSGVMAIASGADHSVVVKSDGRVLAWGNNQFGQTTVPVAAQSGIAAIAAGWDHTVALKTDGSVVAWGWNVWGKTTVPLAAQSGVIAIAAGNDQTVALKADGSVIAWGAIYDGRDHVLASVPTDLGRVTAIAAGREHTVVLVPPDSPKITSTPVDQAINVAQTTNFTVAAVGYDVRYQWRHDGKDIAGATRSEYYVVNAQTNQAGGYTVVVSNRFGSVTSAPPAMLTVTQFPPFITTSPASQAVNAWQSASFAVEATGYPLSYQ